MQAEQQEQEQEQLQQQQQQQQEQQEHETQQEAPQQAELPQDKHAELWAQVREAPGDFASWTSLVSAAEQAVSAAECTLQGTHEQTEPCSLERQLLLQAQQRHTVLCVFYALQLHLVLRWSSPGPGTGASCEPTSAASLAPRPRS